MKSGKQDFGRYVRDVLCGGEVSGDDALRLITLRGYLSKASDWDAVNGRAMSTSIDRVIRRINASCEDRLLRAANAAYPAFREVTESLHSNILRDHAVMPIRDAREFDSESMRWISQLPGNTIREKLVDKQRVMAVRRITSYDTVENRLVKEFAILLVRLLERRAECLGEEEEAAKILSSLREWLHSEDAAAINRQTGIEPNNTLLHDKNYRRIWHSWRALHTLSSDTAKDLQRLDSAQSCVLKYLVISRLHRAGAAIVQMPVAIDWDGMTLDVLCDMPIMVRMADGRTLEISAHSRGFAITSNDAPQPGNSGERIKSYNITVDGGSAVMNGEKLPSGIEAAADEIAQKILGAIPLKGASSVATGGTVTPMECGLGGNGGEEGIAAIDLYAVRPRYCIGGGKDALLPANLLEQRWRVQRISQAGQKDASDVCVSCEMSDAILTEAECGPYATISMKDAFMKVHDKDATEAVGRFARTIYYLLVNAGWDGKRLCYAVPDYVDVFALSAVSSAINREFRASSPLPRSIAAAAEWQSSASFDECKAGDIVLAADLVDYGGRNEISITTLQAKYEKKLQEAAGDTRGIYWVRHPSFCVKCVAADGAASDCVTRLFGTEGIESGSYKTLYMVSGGRLQDTAAGGGDASGALNNVKMTWRGGESGEYTAATQTLDIAAVKKELDDIQVSKKGRIFILPLCRSISVAIPKPLAKQWSVLPVCGSVVQGAASLCKRQDAAGDIPCWKDYLPNLSIEVIKDGRYQKFYLVKDAQIAPMQKGSVNLPVKNSFNLSAGAAQYKFPLWQGDGGEAMEWAAEIKSTSFPLEHDVMCRMIMTYTYGNDIPYELRLVPSAAMSGQSGADGEVSYRPFDSISVNWTKNDDGDKADDASLIPPFLEHKTWDDLRCWPNADKTGFNNLIDDWCIKCLNEIVNRIGKPASGRVKSDWYGNVGKIDKTGKWYWFVTLPNGEDVFCHSVDFAEPCFPEQITQGSVLYFLAVPNTKKGGWRGKYITASGQCSWQCLQKMLYICRFPVIQIWNECRSLSDADAPDNLREAIANANTWMANAYGKADESLKNEIEVFCAAMHKDCGVEAVPNALLSRLDGKYELQMYDIIKIGRIIGDATLDWQKEMLRRVLGMVQQQGEQLMAAVRMLAIAMWRCERFVFCLDANNVDAIIKAVYSLLAVIKNDIAGYAALDSSGKKKIQRELGSCVELYLAILRIRASDREEIRSLVLPRTTKAMQCVKMLDDICDALAAPAVRNDFAIKSYIDVDAHKDERLYAIPDLIYALRQFLAGNSTHISVRTSDEWME